jgi:uncharacterized membrane protein
MGLRTSRAAQRPARRRSVELEGQAVAFGVVLVIIGLIFLAESLGITEFGIRELWPLILIGVGAVILYERLRRAWRRRGQ